MLTQQSQRKTKRNARDAQGSLPLPARLPCDTHNARPNNTAITIVGHLAIICNLLLRSYNNSRKETGNKATLTIFYGFQHNALRSCTGVSRILGSAYGFGEGLGDLFWLVEIYKLTPMDEMFGIDFKRLYTENWKLLHKMIIWQKKLIK